MANKVRGPNGKFVSITSILKSLESSDKIGLDRLEIIGELHRRLAVAVDLNSQHVRNADGLTRQVEDLKAQVAAKDAHIDRLIKRLEAHKVYVTQLREFLDLVFDSLIVRFLRPALARAAQEICEIDPESPRPRTKLAPVDPWPNPPHVPLAPKPAPIVPRSALDTERLVGKAP